MRVRVIEGVVGNVDKDHALAAARDRHREQETLEHLRVDDTQRRRSRFRARTDAGTELGVVVPDTEPLTPGDVLLDDDVMIVVELAEIPTLAVTFAADTEPTTAAVVGHTAGNRHWDLAIENRAIHVPAGPNPERRVRLLEELLPADATLQRAAVEPALFDRGAPTDVDRSEESKHDNLHDESDNHPHNESDNHHHPRSEHEDTPEVNQHD